jgi:predicted transcriptional regulator
MPFGARCSGRAAKARERDIADLPASVLRPERYQIGIIDLMAMTLRLSDEQTEALRRRADREGRSMQQVALSALEDYLVRAEDDERTDRLAEKGAQRYAELLRRLGE